MCIYGGRENMRPTTVIMNEMLESVKRLNTELDSRCDFESMLITHIDELKEIIETKNEQIEKLRKDISEKDKCLHELNKRIEVSEERVKKFNRFLTKYVLPENKQIVFNAQTEDFEITEQ